MKRPDTNIDRITHFCNFSKHGALGQIFVIEAVMKYAEMVENMTQAEREEMDKGFIAYETWASVAREASEAVDPQR